MTGFYFEVCQDEDFNQIHPPPLAKLATLAAAMTFFLLPASTATADVVRAHNNYKPTIALTRSGPNVLTGCGEQGRVATLRLRIPPSQNDGNAWDGSFALQIQATGSFGKFERRASILGQNWLPWIANWPITQLMEGEHTIEVRTRTGQNIGYGDGAEMFLKLVKHPSSPQSSKYEVFSPAIRILAAGGKGCQTRAQNPTCRGFWYWPGFDQTTGQMIGPPECLLK